MEKSTLKMSVSATGPGTILTVRFDDETIWQDDPSIKNSEIVHEFEDTDDAQHLLSIEMSGKTQDHTKVNDAGEIIEDLLVHVGNFALNDIDIDQLVWTLAEYRHDFNGTKESVTEKFYGTMGCNGTVTMRFTSPAFLWLLENL